MARVALLVRDGHDEDRASGTAIDKGVGEWACEDLSPVRAAYDRPAFRGPNYMLKLAGNSALEASDQARAVFLRAVPLDGPLKVRDRFRVPSDLRWHGSRT